MNSAVAVKESLGKPKGKPVTYLLRQRRLQNRLYTRYTWRHTASQSTNQLRCNEHHDIAEPTYETRATIQSSIHLPPGLVMMSVKETEKACHVIQYNQDLNPVDELEVFVVPIKAYNLVLGLPGQETRK
jgi:hypothetical protein